MNIPSFYFTEVGKACSEYLIRALVDGCVDTSSPVYKKILRALTELQPARTKKYRFQVKKESYITPFYKVGLAIVDKKVVGLLFIEKDTVWIYVSEGFRDSRVATNLWSFAIKKCPLLNMMADKVFVPYTSSKADKRFSRIQRTIEEEKVQYFFEKRYTALRTNKDKYQTLLNLRF